MVSGSDGSKSEVVIFFLQFSRRGSKKLGLSSCKKGHANFQSVGFYSNSLRYADKNN